MQFIHPGWLCLVAMLSICPIGSARAQADGNACGSVLPTTGQGGFGPFDYRSNRDKWAVVESVHFTPQVEALVRGQSGSVAQDIAYTLNVFPNHHRALLAATRLAEREKTPKPVGMKYSIDCYFERAIGFARDDNVTRLLFANHLSKNNRKREAVVQIDDAVATAGDNALTHFNAGLLYFEADEFDKALRQAHRAAELGMVNPALKNRLQTAGKWQEPTSTAISSARPGDAAASTAQPASRP